MNNLLPCTSCATRVERQAPQPLRRTLTPYIAAGRKLPGKPAPGRRRSGDGVTRLYYPKIIRRWAEANRVELPKRGRIPQRIIEQFEAHEETRRR